MALQLGATRDAFLAANVPPDKASAAAEELANYDARINDVSADLKIIKWMLGALYAPVIAILLKLFIP